MIELDGMFFIFLFQKLSQKTGEDAKGYFKSNRQEKLLNQRNQGQDVLNLYNSDILKLCSAACLQDTIFKGTLLTVNQLISRS